ncbi:MAG: SRPBCC family protein [Bdellovibrionales bacterium]|jgi:ribosome-associated toxin RatA of RatAB toxin-antitoxin module|nr:SRPBCC family protein [Bdellovibrionales bacterium]
MAAASHTEVFNCTPEEFFKLVTDYASYPEFLSDVKECKVVKQDGEAKYVEYKVSVVKTITYQLKTIEAAPSLVSWTFASGDVFKTMDGSWKIEDAGGGKCRCTYAVEGTFKIFVPGPIAKTLLNVNLPAMMAAYHNRIKAVYGK